jgi:hypothetical protein
LLIAESCSSFNDSNPWFIAATSLIRVRRLPSLVRAIARKY